MKTAYTFLLFFWYFLVSAQNVFPIKIEDFSDRYEAVIEESIQDTLIRGVYEDYVPRYIIRVLAKEDKKEILSAYAMDYPSYLINENGEVLANIKELPYGSQSVLIYEDFNFDGNKDLALMNGYQSCYGGPSFDIYLATTSGFEYSKSFSALGNEYCGMFTIDEEAQSIHTMVKSGCCWHQFSEFSVVDNEPKLIRTLTMDAFSGQEPYFIEEVLAEWQGDEVHETVNLLLPYDDRMEVLMFFMLAESEKHVVIFAVDNILYYALERPDKSVEFYYPKPYYDENLEETQYGNPFIYNKTSNTLSFANLDAQYVIYENEDNFGIKVITKGREYELKGMVGSKKGSLQNLDSLPADEFSWGNLKYD